MPVLAFYVLNRKRYFNLLWACPETLSDTVGDGAAQYDSAQAFYSKGIRTEREPSCAFIELFLMHLPTSFMRI
jgi:hypothetical protein